MKPIINLDFADFPRSFDKENNFFINLLRQRFDVRITTTPDFLIYAVFGLDFLKYDCVRIFYTGENTRPNFNDCDYAFSFDHLDYYDKNYRLPYWREYNIESLFKPKDPQKIRQEKTEFCNFVYSNPGAKERNTFYKMLEQYKHIHSGGRTMNNIGGPVADKVAFQKKFKFSIAFENSSFPGYATEKIIHAFMANTIPIYWGDPEIAKDFNPKAFINCHEFPSFEAVIAKIKEIDANDTLFEQYIAEPCFRNDQLPAYLTDEAILDRFTYIFNQKIEPIAQDYIVNRYSTGRIKKYLWLIELVRGGILYIPRKIFLGIMGMLNWKKRETKFLS